MAAMRICIFDNFILGEAGFIKAVIRLRKIQDMRKSKKMNKELTTKQGNGKTEIIAMLKEDAISLLMSRMRILWSSWRLSSRKTAFN